MKTKIEKTKSSNRGSSPFFNSKNSSGFFGVQPKLKVGQPGDKYEVEADRVAEEVVSYQPDNQPFFAAPQTQLIQQKPIAERITPLVQLQEEEEEELQPKLLDTTVQRQEEEEEELQMQSEDEEEEMLQTQLIEEEEEMLQPSADSPLKSSLSATEQKLNSSKTSGKPLGVETRKEMERSFGVDFSGIKVHTDSTAVQLNKELGAQAFTSENNIYFNEGKYNPQSQGGKRLLAHELTHTVQQGGKTASKYKQNNINKNKRFAAQNTNNTIQLTPDEDFLNTSDIQLMQCVTSFDNLYQLSSNYSIGSRQIGDAVRAKYLAEAAKYTTAYTSYSSVIRAARQEAQNQNQWIGIIAGITTGIALGLLAAWVLPVTATAGAFTITLGEAGTAFASAAGQAGVGTLMTSGVTSALSVVGGDLQPSGLAPEIIRTNIWRKAAEIYREGLQQVAIQQRLHWFALQASDVRRQVQQRLNGRNTTLSMPQLYNIVPVLYNLRTTLFPAGNIYQHRLNQQNSINSQLNRVSNVTSNEMEKGIWILWINSLDLADSDLLDLDAIENHLQSIGIIGTNSILGVDFGSWTSKADEVNAIIASISHAGRIRTLFEHLQTAGVNVEVSPTPFSSS
jgi:hypothetical protein